MTAAETAARRWLPYRRPVRDPAVRLICVPHAGGSASAFRQWPARLPPRIEVCAVQLPGRETRWRDEPPPTLSALVDELAAALLPLFGSRFALCGTSFGALVAFRLARRLREVGLAAPARLVVAAMPAPDRLRVPDLESVDDVVLAEMVARSPGPAPPGTELALLTRRSLGLDLRLAATYAYAAEPALDCPISVFGGRTDPAVPVDDLVAWRSHTTAACPVHLLPGGHFAFRDSADLLLREIAADLAEG